jgi:predicted RNase H-like HicB family nuclease
MKNKSAIHIFWSDEDEGYIAVCKEVPGLSAFGETREQALEEEQVAIDAMIATFRLKNIPLPEPSQLVAA